MPRRFQELRNLNRLKFKVPSRVARVNTVACSRGAKLVLFLHLVVVLLWRWRVSPHRKCMRLAELALASLSSSQVRADCVHLHGDGASPRLDAARSAPLQVR